MHIFANWNTCLEYIITFPAHLKKILASSKTQRISKNRIKCFTLEKIFLIFWKQVDNKCQPRYHFCSIQNWVITLNEKKTIRSCTAAGVFVPLLFVFPRKNMNIELLVRLLVFTVFFSIFRHVLAHVFSSSEDALLL